MINYKVLLILVIVVPYISARIPNRNLTESNSRELSGDWGLNLDGVSFKFVDNKINVIGSITTTNGGECLKDIGILGKWQCIVVAVAPTSIYFDSDKAISGFTCAGAVVAGYYESSLPMYYACATFTLKGDLIKWKARDLFKEKTGCPVWVIWLAITIGCVLIVVLSCWCCCKCCCGKKRKRGCC